MSKVENKLKKLKIKYRVFNRKEISGIEVELKKDKKIRFIYLPRENEIKRIFEETLIKNYHGDFFQECNEEEIEQCLETAALFQKWIFEESIHRLKFLIESEAEIRNYELWDLIDDGEIKLRELEKC